MDKWTIDKESEEAAKESVSNDRKALKKWTKFTEAVTNNLFYHPKFPQPIAKANKNHKYRCFVTQLI